MHLCVMDKSLCEQVGGKAAVPQTVPKYGKELPTPPVAYRDRPCVDTA